MNTVNTANESKSISYKRILWILLTVLWMMLIFYFSSRPADLSSEDSSQAGMMVGRLLHPDFEEWPKEKQEAYAESIDYPVRKTAHACEYAVLGMLLLSAWRSRRQKQKRRLPAPFCAWVTAALYASSDEFHQLFVPGRSGMIQDVLLDSCGAFAGILLIWVLTKLIRRKHSDSTASSPS